MVIPAYGGTKERLVTAIRVGLSVSAVATRVRASTLRSVFDTEV